MTVEVYHVPPALIPMAWVDIAPLIAPAVDMADGRHTLSTTQDRLQGARMQALLCLRDARPLAACVTQVGLYPAQKWLQVPFCGGREMRVWLEPLLDVLDGLAYDNGCVGIEISGRGGWSRVLRRFGFRPAMHHPALLVKPLGIGARQAQKRAAE
jgi:hypothetical protein